MLKRRQFIQISAAGSLVYLLQKPKSLRATSSKTINWRLAMAAPKTLPVWGEGLQRFAKTVKDLSNNYFNITVYGAGELLPALATFDAVKSGSIELGHSASYYWQGKIPAAVFFCAIPFGMDAACASAWLALEGKELWQELMQPYGVISLPCGNTGPQCIGWYRKRLHDPNDLKGLKIRIPGLAGKVFASAGATPVLLPGSELFTSLATGVIDAVEWLGPYHDQLMGFSKAVKYYYGSGWHEPNAVLELMINQKAWDTLSKELQEIIKIAASEADHWMTTEWNMRNTIYLEKVRSEQVQLLKLPEAILAEFSKHTKQVLNEIVMQDPRAEKISKSYYNFLANYQAYLEFVDYR